MLGSTFIIYQGDRIYGGQQIFSTQIKTMGFHQFIIESSTDNISIRGVIASIDGCIDIFEAPLEVSIVSNSDHVIEFSAGTCVSIEDIISQVSCVSLMDICYSVTDFTGGLVYNEMLDKVCVSGSGDFRLDVTGQGTSVFNGLITITSTEMDNDGDGIPDHMDRDLDNDGIPNEDDDYDDINDISYDDTDDNDNDGIPDDQDDTPNGPVDEICDNGIDDDGDGLIDCADSECELDPIHISISLDQHASCVDTEGGQVTVRSDAHDLSTYNICIDDACADDEGIINQLPAGDHDLIISNSEDCPVPYTVTAEICDNDIDDDGDGYVDCEDLDCFSAKSDNCLAFDEEINTCILMNLELFNELNLESIEDSGLFCETLMQNPFAREIEEKDNCITIISSSASSEFASGQLIAIPDYEIGDDRLYPNPNARLKGGDLASNDYSREEALVLLSQQNQFLLQEHVTPQFLLARMRSLFNTLTVRNPFTYRKVADRFIERFELFDGQDLVDNELNELLTETNAFKNDVKDLGKQVSCSLSPLHPIDETQTYNLPDNPLKNDAFRFVYTAAEGYVFRGPFVLIHDTDNIEYNLISFDGDVSDGKWDACFSIRSTDNFGLDTDDFLEFQNYETDKLDLGFNVDFGIGTGIASWWLLQHVYGFETFRNVMLFEVCIQGEINDCNCG